MDAFVFRHDRPIAVRLQSAASGKTPVIWSPGLAGPFSRLERLAHSQVTGQLPAAARRTYL
jgi:hypothetical protein